MTDATPAGLPAAIASARPVLDIEDLAAAWFCQRVQFRVSGAGASAPVGIGAHVRQSFLGALGPAASPAASVGCPCDWDPPCALDVFCREQLRGPRGDGLPKPYVIDVALDHGDLLIGLSVFGMANDWFMAAAEAVVTGLRTILPWHHLYPGMRRPPDICDRRMGVQPLRNAPDAGGLLRLRFLSPLDMTGTQERGASERVLNRLLSRIDGISRWNGVALEPTADLALSQQFADLNVDLTRLRSSRQLSPNAKGQRRVRATALGEIVVRGDWRAFWPLFAMGLQTHLGRGAVEGYGRFEVDTNP